jgi:hypothetical protein
MISKEESKPAGMRMTTKVVAMQADSSVSYTESSHADTELRRQITARDASFDNPNRDGARMPDERAMDLSMSPVDVWQMDRVRRPTDMVNPIEIA